MYIHIIYIHILYIYILYIYIHIISHYIYILLYICTLKHPVISNRFPVKKILQLPHEKPRCQGAMMPLGPEAHHTEVLVGKGHPFRSSRGSCETSWEDGDLTTLWLFNIAMGNGPFKDGLPIKNGNFPWLC